MTRGIRHQLKPMAIPKRPTPIRQRRMAKVRSTPRSKIAAATSLGALRRRFSRTVEGVAHPASTNGTIDVEQAMRFYGNGSPEH